MQINSYYSEILTNLHGGICSIVIHITIDIPKMYNFSILTFLFKFCTHLSVQISRYCNV